ncbi:hypothetical protein ACLB1N_15050 [Escherichia coli]
MATSATMTSGEQSGAAPDARCF